MDGTYFASRVPGQSIGTGYASAFTDANSWSLLNFVESASKQSRSSAVNLTGFTGGAQGIGAGLDGVLSDSTQSGDFSVGDFFETNSGSSGRFGGFDGEVSAFPFDGFKAVGDVVPIARNGTANIRLGSLQAVTGTGLDLAGGGGLCLGSAAATCNGVIIPRGWHRGGEQQPGIQTPGGLTNILSVNLPNTLNAELRPGQFSVKGDIGGTVKVGSVQLGRVIPVNFQFPNASSMLSSTSTRQQQSVRDSFRGRPAKPGLGQRNRLHRTACRKVMRQLGDIRCEDDCEQGAELEAEARQARYGFDGLGTAAQVFDERLGVVPRRQQARGFDLLERRRLGIAVG